LLELSEIRLEAALWQIAAIINDDGFLRIRYTDPSRIKQLARNSAIKLRIADDRTAYVTVPKSVSGGALMVEFVKSLLQT
jgi:transcription-repair coupling factor (superfamily II helicase)